MENRVGSEIVDISRPWRFAKRARAATGPALTPRPIGPTPMWVQRLQEVLGPWAIGYAFGAAHTDIATNQTALYGYTQGLTRSWTQPSEPGKRWAADSRCNLASVSKFIAAVAIVKFLPTISKTINDTFLPLIRDRLGSSFTPGRHVDQVTIKQLLTMTSGLEIDKDLRFHGEADIWSFLRSYLHKDVIGVLDYNNTNFTVLQAIIEAQTGGSFVDWLRQNVLKPMGIDIDDEQAFSATPDPEGTATLAYRDATDHRWGKYIEHIPAEAAGGLITSAELLLKFMVGLRGETVLTHNQTEAMLRDELGCYPHQGVYGTYYHHNGGLGYYIDGDPSGVPTDVHTGLVRFTDGWDAVLLVNSTVPLDPIPLLIGAFETTTPDDLTPVFRYNNPASGAYYLTAEPAPPTSATSWDFQGIHFYTPVRAKPGAPPVAEYENNGFYYYNPDGAPSDAWVEQNPPFSTLQPMGNNNPIGASPLTAYKSLQANKPDCFLYTSDPSQEKNLSDFTFWCTNGFVHSAIATPIFGYTINVGPDHTPASLLTTNPWTETVNDWTPQGITFYALAFQATNAFPLYRFYYYDNWYFHWFTPTKPPEPRNRTLWGAEPERTIWIYPQKEPGTVELYEFTYDTRHDVVQYLSTNPAPRPGFTLQGSPGYVYNPEWIR